MNISINSNIGDAVKKVSALHRDIVPKATRNTVNDLAFQFREEIGREWEQTFDKPVKFTTSKSAWTVNKATVASQIASVTLKPRQAQYMQYQLRGGTRTPKNKALAKPYETMKAKHGGFMRNWRKEFAKPHRFTGIPKGQPYLSSGLYKRVGATTKKQAGEKIELLYSFHDKFEYQKQFNLQKHSFQIAKKNAKNIFISKLNYYINKNS